MIAVTLVGSIGEAAGTRKTEVDADTVAEVLEALGARYGAGFRKKAKASRIMVNGAPIQFSKGIKTRLSPGDEVALLVPVGGG